MVSEGTALGKGAGRVALGKASTSYQELQDGPSGCPTLRQERAILWGGEEARARQLPLLRTVPREPAGQGRTGPVGSTAPAAGHAPFTRGPQGTALPGFESGC